MDEPTLARFMAKVNKTENCWLWIGSTDGYGHYGKINVYGKTISSHRLSYLHHHGEIQKGFIVRHKCKNMLCVNPNHLELGTYSQNNGEDKWRDGTMTFKKITDDEITSIRIRYELGRDVTYTSVAREFGISPQKAWDIITRRLFKYLP